MRRNSNPALIEIATEETRYFQFVDTADDWFQQSRVSRILERYHSYFIDMDNLRLSPDLNYVKILELIEKIKNTFNRIGAPELYISNDVQRFIDKNRYAIDEHRLAGETIKAGDERWAEDIENFKLILDLEITRPLKSKQVLANFSVPGAGKTAMMFGSFAYLSSSEIDVVNKILVVCPINAFEAWRTEFVEMFRDKRQLTYMNLRNSCYREMGAIRTDWGKSDVIVINFEALQGKNTILNELIDEKTMIVFDEVHRVKGIGGSRAKAALTLGKTAKYHYVLTGTPIPNSYQDVYNFLHLLYDNEYDTYFGWDKNDLISPNPDVINNKIYPFFWRTNKRDLQVPKADSDNLVMVEPTSRQLELVQAIYENEDNFLARYIRLLQASTNPALLLDSLNYRDLGFLDGEIDFDIFSALSNEEKENARLKAYRDLKIKRITSSKFDAGIDLILNLVNQDKKVIVWGMFVKTMQKIQKQLQQQGVTVNLVYGETPKTNRVDLINEFRDGDIKVLISNPNTLGESISLHQSVSRCCIF